MIYHIVTGDAAAAPIKEMVALEPYTQEQVLIIKDVLSLGPLKKQEGQKFSELRSAFWHEIAPNEKNPVKADDLERLLLTANELSKNENTCIWFWLAPLPADTCTYYWALKYLEKYKGRVLVVNIAGLPFLDENGKIVFPKSISEILPKEIIKARKLARPINPGELEVDIYEWGRLVDESSNIRTLEGGKRLKSQRDDFYDKDLMSFCTQQYQKASRIIHQAIGKYNMPTGDLYLGWRLKKMADTNQLQLQGDLLKGLKDFEVKLHDGLLL